MTGINIRHSKGFTLIELLIVLALFVFIIDATVSIFVSIVHHQKRVLADQELLDQANYVLESISNSLKMAQEDKAGICLYRDAIRYPGYFYILTHRDGDSGFYQGIKFLNANGICEEFFLDNDGQFKKSDNVNLPQNIISSKFNIVYARFLINGDKTVTGSSKNALAVPRVTMVLNIQHQTEGSLQGKVIQTTISQRNY